MTDLFEENKPKEQGTPEGDKPTGVESTETYLSLILNDKGEQKYSTAEEALKGSVHAQSHITKLESELQELRDNAEKNTSMEDILKALENKAGDKPAEQLPAGITADDVASQVESIINKRDEQTTIKENITTVTSIFKELFGEKASETMYGKAEDLGFSRDEINSMIATNPTATLKVLGVEGIKPTQKDPVTDVNGHVLDFSGGKPKEKAETIMGATNSKDLTDAWELSKAETNKRLGIEA